MGRAGQNVIIDNGAVVNIKTGEYPTDNGGLNDKNAALMNSVSEKSKQLRETYGALMQAGVSADSIRTVLTAEQDKIMALYTTAIEENKDNIFVIYAQDIETMPFQDLKALISSLLNQSMV